MAAKQVDIKHAGKKTFRTLTTFGGLPKAY